MSPRSYKKTGDAPEEIIAVFKPKGTTQDKQRFPEAEAWKLAAINLEIVGIPHRKIARMLKKAPNTVAGFLKSEGAVLLRRSVFGASTVEEIKTEMRAIWPLALRAVTDLLSSDDPDLIVQKANKGLEILVALGAKEADKTEITHKHIIEAAREAIIVAAKEAQKLEEEKTITIGNA